jgi:hypothetical protein
VLFSVQNRETVGRKEREIMNTKATLPAAAMKRNLLTSIAVAITLAAVPSARATSSTWSTTATTGNWSLECIPCLPPCAPTEARALQFYVAANGNDTNLGTLQKPFETLQRAQQAARNVAGLGM